MWLKHCTLVFLVLVAWAAAAEISKPASEESTLDSVYRFMQECGNKDISFCLKMRALKFVDSALHQGDIDLSEGVALLKTDDAGSAATGRALNDDLESSLPSSSEARDAQVEALLADRVARFLGSHTLQLKVPENAIADMKRSIDEGRKKKKKLLLPLLLALKLKAAALIPLVLGGLALLALKALVIGKLALVLSALIALQKLFANQHSSKTVEVVAHPTYSHHGGEHDHYGRSMPDPQTLAYRAHAQN